MSAYSNGEVPRYWDDAIAGLSKRDRVLKKIIANYPRSVMTCRGEPFFTLARAIVGQQISVKAAQSVWGKLMLAYPEFTAEKMLRARVTRMRTCGLSERKAEYIRDLASHLAQGKIEPSSWAERHDDDIIKDLIQVKGIGRWTAEMFLMFNLLRADILPLGDIGLLNAIHLHYNDSVPMHLDDIKALAEKWRPWRSVATWFLWRSLDPIPVEY